MSLRAYAVTFRFKGSTPAEVPLVNRGDIVFVSVNDNDANPFVATLKTPRAEGQMPRSLLKAVPEPHGSRWLAQFEADVFEQLTSVPLPDEAAISPKPFVLPAPSDPTSSPSPDESSAPPPIVRPSTRDPPNPDPNVPPPSDAPTPSFSSEHLAFPASPEAPGAPPPAPASPPTSSPPLLPDDAPSSPVAVISLAPPATAPPLDTPPGGTPPLLFASDASPRVTLAQAGGSPLILYELVGGIYRHKADPRLPALTWTGLADDGQPVTRSYWVLGMGAYGITFRCSEPRDGAQRDVAIKVTGPQRDLELRNFFHNEGFLSASLRHPNVMKAAGPPFEAQLQPGGPLLRCLVTPFCECGDLDQAIRRYISSPSADPLVDQIERGWLLVDLICGLAYLHGKPFDENDHRVLHNDLKPANVLLRRDPTKGRLMALLADLGFACVFTGGSLSLGLTRGTPGFQAPELYYTAETQTMLEASRLRPGNTPATDVYSLGVTLYCLYSRTDTDHKTEERPSEAELREVFAEVADLESKAGHPQGTLVGLLVAMCSPDPTARPDMRRVREAVEPVADLLSRLSKEQEDARRKKEEEARQRLALCDPQPSPQEVAYFGRLLKTLPQMKLVLVSHGMGGKSPLWVRFHENRYPKKMKATLGSDVFFTKRDSFPGCPPMDLVVRYARQ
ncbi:putative Protein kinase domain [Paratrimastix pyriformis]|uniref:Protein kinase domain-containing protein n=1 Tax=Paratrimastix pyriformis TaxID=342808 RepID=A0ABQ8UTE3_9EUKA|nr:putative Protein kinase domain [Paratrimastix pyriformis]